MGQIYGGKEWRASRIESTGNPWPGWRDHRNL